MVEHFNSSKCSWGGGGAGHHLDHRGLSGEGPEVIVEDTQTNDVHPQAQELSLHICLLHTDPAHP